MNKLIKTAVALAFAAAAGIAGAQTAAPTPAPKGDPMKATPATPASGPDLRAGRLRDLGPSGHDSSD